MEKEFVPYVLSVELKELGFNEPCFKVYDNMGFLQEESVMNTCEIECDCILERYLAPLYQQAFRWFREKYQIDSWITKEHKYQNPFCWYIQDNITEYNSDFRTNGLTFETFFQTHKEAELACLNKLIEIVKEKQHDKQYRNNQNTFRIQFSR